jgi:hypothetical protein
MIQIDEPPTHDSARMWATKYYRSGRRRRCTAWTRSS